MSNFLTYSICSKILRVQNILLVEDEYQSFGQMPLNISISISITTRRPHIYHI